MDCPPAGHYLIAAPRLVPPHTHPRLTTTPPPTSLPPPRRPHAQLLHHPVRVRHHRRVRGCRVHCAAFPQRRRAAQVSTHERRPASWNRGVLSLSPAGARSMTSGGISSRILFLLRLLAPCRRPNATPRRSPCGRLPASKMSTYTGDTMWQSHWLLRPPTSSSQSSILYREVARWRRVS